jgi:hypothetical protein
MILSVSNWRLSSICFPTGLQRINGKQTKNGKYHEKPSLLPQETHDKVMFFLCRMFLSCIDSSRDELDVGKEMPISRIVVAVPNATVVLLD